VEERGPWRHGCSIGGQQQHSATRKTGVAALVARHGDLPTRVARSYSLCADDAEDAVQRALEIYMRRVESLDPATELASLKVVRFSDAPRTRPRTAAFGRRERVRKR
jgi:hypothetical protein